MRNIVGHNVKKARHLHTPKITQSDLAARLQLDGWNIDRAGVAKIELSLREVTDIELKKLAKALNTSTSFLLGETNDNR